MEIRNVPEVIKDIQTLIKQEGYFYSLCMILFEDARVNVEKIQETDHTAKLSVKELSLILGFIVQNELNFERPKNDVDIIKLKRQTYDLMKELHQAINSPFFTKLISQMKEGNVQEGAKDFFGQGEMMMEPIFYSGTGVFDFQYFEFIDEKYKYDTDWLKKNKGFDIGQSKEIALEIKKKLEEKATKVNLRNFQEVENEIIGRTKKRHSKKEIEKYFNEYLPAMEIHQYLELFFEYEPESDDFKEEGWKSFYKALIELFTIRKSDFNSYTTIDAFMNNFSNVPGEDNNLQFKTVGNYNVINSHPIVKLDEDKYFIPSIFLLFEAIYENPFYWMWLEDKSYQGQLSQNRGKVGEEITHKFLSKVFGEERTFKSVLVAGKKGETITDIDVLCLLGNKAICVQVKSKKLTEVARSGNDTQLNKDFQGAVQDAYEQGLVSRNELLKRDATFLTEDGLILEIPEDIDEVYIVCVTTENYPSLTHQAHVMLEKEATNPYPLVITVFDLDLLAHYLEDPFEFLYYVRQRTTLMEYFKADEEIVFLGYHLTEKLWKTPNTDWHAINTSVGRIIDRNYYPLKAGLNVSDEGDILANKKPDVNFQKLCECLMNTNSGKRVDLIFNLFNYSEEARHNLAKHILLTKQKTINDGKPHNISMPPDNRYAPRVVLTYHCENSDNLTELKENLCRVGKRRKYISRGDIWIGLGSLKNSPKMIDVAYFIEENWSYDEDMENEIASTNNRKPKVINFSTNRKIMRNDPCICGSEKKYKKCCGAMN